MGIGTGTLVGEFGNCLSDVVVDCRLNIQTRNATNVYYLHESCAYQHDYNDLYINSVRGLVTYKWEAKVIMY